MFGSLKNGPSATERNRKKCQKKFLYYFKKGFADPKYVSWERGYKEAAHQQFHDLLNRDLFRSLLKKKNYAEIAATAIKIESKTNLLFSFEKMALRDAVRLPKGAKAFSEGLYEYIYGDKSLQERFNDFVEVVEMLPRKQTRVLTWPVVTVFGFIGNPEEHIYLKPTVTKIAAAKYDYPFQYRSRPNWDTYSDLLRFADLIRTDNASLHPKDFIDLQSFIWVMGSQEYPD